jgi:hypothetical protein
MFDAQFYSEALPALTAGACAQRGGCTPVVQVQLADGMVLEVCEVVLLAEGWLGLALHRNGACTGTDFTFLPHAVVTRVTLSLEPAETHKLGFRHSETGPRPSISGITE